MASKLSTFISLFLLILGLKYSCAQIFQDAPCQDLTQAQVQQLFSNEFPGYTPADVINQLILSDELSRRSRRKTWATNKRLEQYRQIQFPGSSLTIANSFRFSYPDGEVSGGYGTGAIGNIPEPYKTWEIRSREVAQWTFNYINQLKTQIQGFAALIPPKNPLDGTSSVTDDCAGRYQATHAEIKLMTRLMVQNDAPEQTSVLMSVSRHMCKHCPDVMAHFARNGRRKIGVITPRRTSYGSKNTIQQPEFVLFFPDGSYRKYTRAGTDANDIYQCKGLSMANPLNGVDGYKPPNVAGPARQIILDSVKNLVEPLMNRTADISEKALVNRNLLPSLRQGGVSCPFLGDGPGGSYVRIFGPFDLTKHVSCPLVQTITGIHGSIGFIGNGIGHGTPAPLIIGSLGLRCDVRTVVPAMGPQGGVSFNDDCPKGYQLTGFHGRAGDVLHSIGITCRRITDGAVYKSRASGGSGGAPFDVECSSRSAGIKVDLWVGDAIDGLALDCE